MDRFKSQKNISRNFRERGRERPAEERHGDEEQILRPVLALVLSCVSVKNRKGQAIKSTIEEHMSLSLSLCLCVMCTGKLVNLFIYVTIYVWTSSTRNEGNCVQHMRESNDKL